jgi:large subunit ribosomal protein L17
LITRGKDDSTHARRVVFSYLQDKEAVSELFREVGAKVADRPGGYTRIIRLGNRLGDNADMCLIELVDYNENLLAETAASKKSTSRRRRGSKSKAQSQQVESTEAVTEEAPVEEVITEEAPAAEAEVEAPAEEVAPVEEAAPAEEEKKDEATDEAKEDQKDS